MSIIYLNQPPLILLEDIPYLWKQNDILILLTDLDNYSVFNTKYLDDKEKEDLDGLKTSYFKKRYIVSRTVLKYVLSSLPGEQSVFKIGTFKDEYGRVHVQDRAELYICISYTENIVSLAISKVNIGIDIELQKSVSLGKFSNFLEKKVVKTGEIRDDPDLLTLFTLKEAFCKFSNKSILFYLNKELDLSNVFYSCYFLNNKYILSIIADPKSHAFNISSLQIINF
jgi:4'-phosphopantetheinyl transferase